MAAGSSSLSRQLAAARAQAGVPSSGIQVTRRGGHQRPSLLFDPKQAADIDTHAVHAMAVEGLEALLADGADPRLGRFRESLFSDESRSLVRELQTREVNQQVDAAVVQYLCLLSPYAGQPAAHRTLEYLVRRYHAQSYCGDALVRCLLPFHDQPIFARAVALLPLAAGSGQPSPAVGKALVAWSPLLKPLQDRGAGAGAGAVLHRAALVARCLRDTALLGAVLATVEEGLRARTLGRHPRLVALYGAVLLETLERMGPLTEAAMRLVLPHLLTAVRARGAVPPEYQLASYMVLSKLASTTALAPPVASALLVALAEGLGGGSGSGGGKKGGGGKRRRAQAPQDDDEGAQEEDAATVLEPKARQELAARGLAAMAAVMHAQGLRALPKECLKHLVAQPALVANAALGLAHALPAAGGQLLAPALLRALGEGMAQGRVAPDAFLTYLTALLPLPAAAAALPGVVVALARAGFALQQQQADGKGGSSTKASEGLLVLLRELGTRDAKAVQAAAGDMSAAERDFLLAASAGEADEEAAAAAGTTVTSLDMHLADGRKRAKALSALAQRWAAGKTGGKDGDSEDVAAALAALHDEEPLVALCALEADVFGPVRARAGTPAVCDALVAALRQWHARSSSPQRGSKKTHKVLLALLRAVSAVASDEQQEGVERGQLLSSVTPLLRLPGVSVDDGDQKAIARLLGQHRAAAAALAVLAPALALPSYDDVTQEVDEAEAGASELEAAATATATAVAQALGQASTEAALAVLAPLLAVRTGQMGAHEAGHGALGAQHAAGWLVIAATAGGSSSKKGGRKAASTVDVAALAAAAVPLLLDGLSSPTPPFGSLVPATTLLEPLAALLPHYQVAAPEAPGRETAAWTHADPTLLRLLSLPSWAQHGKGAGPIYQAALHALLRVSGGALPALMGVAATDAAGASAAARVQALAAAVTVVQALKAAGADVATQQRVLWGEGVLDGKVLPAVLAALAHGERRVREGAVLLLEAVFAPSPSAKSQQHQHQHQQQQERVGKKAEGKKKMVVQTTGLTGITPSSPPPGTPKNSTAVVMNGHAEGETGAEKEEDPALPSPPMTRARRASMGSETDLLMSPSAAAAASTANGKTPKSSRKKSAALPTLQEEAEEEGQEAEAEAESGKSSSCSSDGASWLSAAALGGELARLEALVGFAAALLDVSTRRLLLLDGTNAPTAVRAILLPPPQGAKDRKQPRSEAESLGLLASPSSAPEAIVLSAPARGHLTRCLLRAAAAGGLPGGAATLLLDMALAGAGQEGEEEVRALAACLAAAPTASRARALFLDAVLQAGAGAEATAPILLQLLDGELTAAGGGSKGDDDAEGSLLGHLCRPTVAALPLKEAERGALWARLFAALTQEDEALPAGLLARARRAAAGSFLPGAELVGHVLTALGGGKSSSKKKGGATAVPGRVAVAALEVVQQARQLRLSSSSASEQGSGEAPASAPWALLVPPIVGLLRRAGAGSAAAEGGLEEEFLQLLALETLIDVAADAGGSGMPGEATTVLLSLLEGSPSLHVRNACLRLLAQLAKGEAGGSTGALREAALARVLAWLGKETAQQPDAYSFSLVLRVLESILPAAMASASAKKGFKGTSGGGGNAQLVLETLRVFVRAFPSVLPARRAPLFHTLVRCLGETSLAPLQLLLLLQHHHPDNHHAAATPPSPPSLSSSKRRRAQQQREDGAAGQGQREMIDFLDALAEKASPLQQVLSLADALAGARLLLVRAAGGEEEAEAAVLTLRAKKDGGDAGLALDLSPLLRLDAWGAKDDGALPAAWCGQAALSLLALAAQGLSRRAAAFAAADEAQVGAQRGYLLLIEEVLRVARAATSRLAALEEAAGDESGGVRRLLEAAHARAGECLERMHALLSVPSFVAIIQELIQHDDPLIRRRALQLFHHKLSGSGLLDRGGKRLTRGEQHLILEMVPELLALVGGHDAAMEVDGSEEEDAARASVPVPIQQTAWASLAVLAEGLGAAYPKAFLPVFDRLAGLTAKAGGGGGKRGGASGHVTGQVLASALLCAASAVHALGALALPKLPALVPAVLDVLGPASTAAKPHAPSSSNAPGPKEAALVCVTALLAAVPQFLNPFLPRLVGRLLSTQDDGGAAGASSANMAHALALLATALPPRLLLPVLFTQYAEAQDDDDDGLDGLDGLQRAQGAVRLLAVLRQAIEHHKRGDLLQGQGLAGITTFVLRVLDFRGEVLRPLLLREGEGGESGSGSGEKKRPKKEKEGRKQPERGAESVPAVAAACDAVEAAACETVVALVLRLNEEELRPLFLTLAHWRGEGVGEGLPRRLPFYRVVDALAEKLRGIFVPYFGYIWGDIQADLGCIATPVGARAGAVSAEGKKKGKKRGREQSGEEEDAGSPPLAVGEKGSEVASLVLGALAKCFAYQDEAGLAATEEADQDDGEGFLTQQRFEAMMPYAVGLVAGLRKLLASERPSAADAEAAYLALGEQQLVPCLSQMALAVGRDVLWKPFHHAVLMRTRDGDWAVRLTALRVMLATFRAVGEEYLAMLPESISYLSELLEDERAEVVALCKETIRYIEDLSGEPLDEFM